MKPFSTPMNTLGSLDPKGVADLLAAASDLALVIDERGVIRDMSFQSEELAHDVGAQSSWLGRPWIDTVTVESRPKIEALLSDAANQAGTRWRHLNHPSLRNSERPILYSAARLGHQGQIVAFGRDLRPAAELQRRLVDAQQSLELDYARLRHIEVRHHLLFQTSAEAVVILDGATLKVADRNPAATRLFGNTVKRQQPRGLLHAFDLAGAASLQAMLNTLRVAGRADGVRARLASGQMVALSASLFREGSATMFLLRVTPDAPEAPPSEVKARLLQLAESAPDGLVVIGPDSRIITANAAFLDLAQLASEEAARGERMDRWLGRQEVDLNVLLANLRQRGAMRLFATVIRGENGAVADVEVSAAVLKDGEQISYGLAIRNVGHRLSAGIPSELPHSAENLAELVGRIPLKDLVRQSTDVIERLSIETALRLTGDNRASAAEMLGLSRQSFYVKLRRHGLGDLASDDSGAG